MLRTIIKQLSAINELLTAINKRQTEAEAICRDLAEGKSDFNSLIERAKRCKY